MSHGKHGMGLHNPPAGLRHAVKLDGGAADVAFELEVSASELEREAVAASLHKGLFQTPGSPKHVLLFV